MAAPQRAKRIQLTTPVGVTVYPKLNKPDLGTKEYPKDPPGEYSVKLRVRQDDPAVKQLVARLTELHKVAVESGKEEAKGLKIDSRKKLEAKNGKGLIQVQGFFTEVFDKETEEPTGEIELKFSMKAGGEIKKGPRAGETWTAKPSIVDARGVVLGKAPDIWGGTKGRVAFEVTEGGYFIPGTGLTGISLKLVGFQIVELVQGGQRSAASMGFGSVEGGYSAADDADLNKAAEVDELDQEETTEEAEADAPTDRQDF